jgi:hypothetical protein
VIPLFKKFAEEFQCVQRACLTGGAVTSSGGLRGRRSRTQGIENGTTDRRLP